MTTTSTRAKRLRLRHFINKAIGDKAFTLDMEVNSSQPRDSLTIELIESQEEQEKLDNERKTKHQA